MRSAAAGVSPDPVTTHKNSVPTRKTGDDQRVWSGFISARPTHESANPRTYRVAVLHDGVSSLSCLCLFTAAWRPATRLHQCKPICNILIQLRRWWCVGLQLGRKPVPLVSVNTVQHRPNLMANSDIGRCFRKTGTAASDCKRDQEERERGKSEKSVDESARLA
jgi:hypothetical protein